MLRKDNMLKFTNNMKKAVWNFYLLFLLLIGKKEYKKLKLKKLSMKQQFRNISPTNYVNPLFAANDMGIKGNTTGQMSFL